MQFYLHVPFLCWTQLWSEVVVFPSMKLLFFEFIVVDLLFKVRTIIHSIHTRKSHTHGGALFSRGQREEGTGEEENQRGQGEAQSRHNTQAAVHSHPQAEVDSEYEEYNNQANQGISNF